MHTYAFDKDFICCRANKKKVLNKDFVKSKNTRKSTRMRKQKIYK